MATFIRSFPNSWSLKWAFLDECNEWSITRNNDYVFGSKVTQGRFSDLFFFCTFGLLPSRLPSALTYRRLSDDLPDYPSSIITRWDSQVALWGHFLESVRKTMPEMLCAWCCSFLLLLGTVMMLAASCEFSLVNKNQILSVVYAHVYKSEWYAVITKLADRNTLMWIHAPT